MVEHEKIDIKKMVSWWNQINSLEISNLSNKKLQLRALKMVSFKVSIENNTDSPIRNYDC